MTTRLFRHDSAAILGLLLVILIGCASSPPAKFYQLSSVPGQTQAPKGVAPEQGLIVAIGPVVVPDYLDRPQIVTRLGKNELNLAEFDRWAGSLQDDVNRVLVEDVGHFLPADRFFVVRWTPYIESQMTVPYKVEVRIERFEGSLGEEILLRTQWGLFDRKKALLVKKQREISERMNGSSYDALVAAMSRALEKLSGDIADEIVTLAQKGG